MMIGQTARQSAEQLAHSSEPELMPDRRHLSGSKASDWIASTSARVRCLVAEAVVTSLLAVQQWESAWPRSRNPNPISAPFAPACAVLMLSIFALKAGWKYQNVFGGCPADESRSTCADFATFRRSGTRIVVIARAGIF